MNTPVPTIIFEDDFLLVLNKPAGLAVHEDGRSEVPTLTDWVRKEYPTVVGVGEPMTLQNGETIDRPGVVHRLDKETSGVLVLAKTQEAFLFLKAQFQARTIEKEYRAFVWGVLRDVQGTIDMPIGRSRKDFRLWSAGKDAGGQMRPAVTRFTVLAKNDTHSYVMLAPKTGRTHQLRVHLKAKGYPIIGDMRYAPNKPPALGFTRLALHAHVLSLAHPNGTRTLFEAPLPEDFVRAEKAVGCSE